MSNSKPKRIKIFQFSICLLLKWELSRIYTMASVIRDKNDIQYNPLILPCAIHYRVTSTLWFFYKFLQVRHLLAWAWLFYNLIIHSLLICNWAFTTRKPPDFRKTNLFFSLVNCSVHTQNRGVRWLLVGFVQCSGTNKIYYWLSNEKHHVHTNLLWLGRVTTATLILFRESPAFFPGSIAA